MADVLSAQGDLAGALREYRLGLDIPERLARQDPGNAEWQRDLSVSHERIGSALSAQGDVAGALREQRASLAIDERVAGDHPNNPALKHGLAVSMFNVADALHGARELERAEPLHEKSLALADPLIDCKCLVGLAMLRIELGQRADAQATFARCAALCRKRVQGATKHHPA